MGMPLRYAFFKFEILNKKITSNNNNNHKNPIFSDNSDFYLISSVSERRTVEAKKRNRLKTKRKRERSLKSWETEKK